MKIYSDPIFIGVFFLLSLGGCTNDTTALIDVAGLNLSRNGGLSESPRIALSGGAVLVVWQDFSQGNWEIFLSRSDDGGMTFSPPLNLSGSPLDSSSPDIAVAGQNVYVVWVDCLSVVDNACETSEILLSRSLNGGITFDPSIPVTTSGDQGNLSSPRVTAVGGRVYVVWVRCFLFNVDVQRCATADAFFVFSSDSGALFSGPRNLSASSPESDTEVMSPEMAVDGLTNVYVAWRQRRTTTGLCQNPHVTTTRTFDICFVRSDTEGVTFPNPPANLSDSATTDSFSQKLAVGGGVLSVVWSEGTFVDAEVLSRRSVNGGVSFELVKNISNNSGFSGFPEIAADGVNVFVVWQDSTPGNPEVFFSRSIDSGVSFPEPALNISGNSGSSLLPRIKAGGSAIAVVWEDDTTGNREIFLGLSADAGLSFDPPVNLSESSAGSFSPALALSGGDAFVVWVDNATGNPDIFFRLF